MRDGGQAPDVATARAEVHPNGPDRWALQFIREEGQGRTRREGSLFANRDPAVFAGVASVTLGIP